MTRHSRSDKAAGQRPLRVGEALRHALAQVLAQGNIRDHDLEKVSITVSEVRVSPDLRNATAYVMPLGGGQIDDVMEGLKRCTPYLRGQVARIVKLRYMPKFHFEADRSFDNASKIDALLRQTTEDDSGSPRPDDREERSGDDA